MFEACQIKFLYNINFTNFTSSEGSLKISKNS